MSTRFVLSAPGWRDPDGPLSYAFWYQDAAAAAASAPRTPLAAATEASELGGVLLTSGSLRVGVSVTDAHGAVTDFVAPELVTVTPYVGPASDLLGALDQAVLNADTDAALQLAAGSAQLLSAPDAQPTQQAS